MVTVGVGPGVDIAGGRGVGEGASEGVAVATGLTGEDSGEILPLLCEGDVGLEDDTSS